MVRRSIWIFWPSFISETCSVGITIWRTLRCWPSDTTRCSRFCLTLFSCPEYVLTAYQRNMFFRSRLEDCLDELREDRVQSAQVGTDDQHEEENAPRELGELPAVRPLDALKLRPHRHEERDKPTALVRLGAFRAAAVATRARGDRPPAAVPGAPGAVGGPFLVELVVVGLEARFGLRLTGRPAARSEVVHRGADHAIDFLLELALALGVLGFGGWRARRRSALRQPLVAALLLALPRLGALSVAGHR